jgi:hypothetical protein
LYICYRFINPRSGVDLRVIVPVLNAVPMLSPVDHYIHGVRIRRPIVVAFLLFASCHLVSFMSSGVIVQFVYAGSRISAQLLWRNATPIYNATVSPILSLSFTSLSSHPSALSYAGSLTANMPTAVTTDRFSELVNVETALEAKLGSATVRPFPVICLGGIVAVVV